MVNQMVKPNVYLDPTPVSCLTSRYSYISPLTSPPPLTTIYSVLGEGSPGSSRPPIPPNFQYPPHPCIHTCPTTPPPILQHGNVFIGNRTFPSMPCSQL